MRNVNEIVNCRDEIAYFTFTLPSKIQDHKKWNFLSILVFGLLNNKEMNYFSMRGCIPSIRKKKIIVRWNETRRKRASLNLLTLDYILHLLTIRFCYNLLTGMGEFSANWGGELDVIGSECVRKWKKEVKTMRQKVIMEYIKHFYCLLFHMINKFFPQLLSHSWGRLHGSDLNNQRTLFSHSPTQYPNVWCGRIWIKM